MPKDLDPVDLSEFLKGKDPICREERQYALFLYNILRDMKEINIEGETYYIQEVFFEVSFLRDYFEKCNDKIDFNERLIQFSIDHAKLKTKQDPNSFNMKAVEEVLSDHVNGWTKKGTDANKDVWKIIGTKLPQYLMNTQPDIGLILSPEKNPSENPPEEYYICFIECKYCSGFSKYPSKGDPLDGEEKYEQVEVQKLIAEFLCGEVESGLKAEYNKTALMPLDPNCAMVAWFYRDNAKRKKTHLQAFDGIEFTPGLRLDILIPEPHNKTTDKTINKTIVINNGQLKFQEDK